VFDIAAELASGSKNIIVPIGTHTYSAPLVVPEGVQIVAEGRPVECCLLSDFAAGDCFTMLRDTMIRGVKFGSTVPRTSGATVKMTGNSASIEDFQIWGAYQAIRVEGTPQNATIGNQIRSGGIGATVAASGSAAIVGNYYASLFIDGLTVVGVSPPGKQPDYGIALYAGDSTFISNVNLTNHGRSGAYPPLGKNLVATYITNVIFDWPTSNFANAFEMVGGGKVIDFHLANCWCSASTTASGLYIVPPAGAVVDGITITGCTFINCEDSGIRAHGSMIKNLTVTGSLFGNSGNGINISGGVSRFSLIGNRVGPCDTFGPNNRGIWVSGNCDYYSVQGNIVTGNTESNLLDQGSGTHKSVTGNVS
jgi:hypothetical protein